MKPRTRSRIAVSIGSNQPVLSSLDDPAVSSLLSFSMVSYQSPYPVTVWAQLRLVSEAIRSGIRMSLFQPSQHASMIAS